MSIRPFAVRGVLTELRHCSESGTGNGAVTGNPGRQVASSDPRFFGGYNGIHPSYIGRGWLDSKPPMVQRSSSFNLYVKPTEWKNECLEVVEQEGNYFLREIWFPIKSHDDDGVIFRTRRLVALWGLLGHFEHKRTFRILVVPSSWEEASIRRS